MPSNVYVTQEQPKLNYLPAQKFGDIVFLVADDFSPVAGSLSNVKLIEQIKQKLKAFDEANDYVVFSGSPTVAAAVFAHLGSKGVNSVRVLRWSNQNLHYTPITISNLK